MSKRNSTQLTQTDNKWLIQLTEQTGSRTEKQEKICNRFEGPKQKLALAFWRNVQERVDQKKRRPEEYSHSERSIEGITLLGEKPIGDGGSSEVWKGEFTGQPGEFVAVKIIHEQDIRRVAREVSLLKQISHPNIVGFRDHLKSSLQEDCIIMEWVEGHTLEENSLTPTETRKLGIQLAGALRELHTRLLIHRDVKPANILVHGDSVKLLDLGAVKDQNDDMTTEGVAIGTPRFMSPEQREASPEIDLDHRTDFFSLGRTLEFVLKTNGRMSSIRERLEKVIHRCTENDRENRYSNVSELLDALDSCDTTKRRRQALLTADPADVDEEVLGTGDHSAADSANDTPDSGRESDLPTSPETGDIQPTEYGRDRFVVGPTTVNGRYSGFARAIVVSFFLVSFAAVLAAFFRPFGNQANPPDQESVNQTDWKDEFIDANKLLCNSLRIALANSQDAVHVAKTRDAALSYLNKIRPRLTELDRQTFIQIGKLAIATARSLQQDYDLQSAEASKELLTNLIADCDQFDRESREVIALKSRAQHELAIVYHLRLDPESAEAQYVATLETWKQLLDSKGPKIPDKVDWVNQDRKWIESLGKLPEGSEDTRAGIARVFGYLGDLYYDKHSNQYALATYSISLALRESLAKQMEKLRDDNGAVSQQAFLQAKHQMMLAQHNLLRLGAKLIESEPAVTLDCLERLGIDANTESVRKPLLKAHFDLLAERANFLDEIQDLQKELRSKISDDFSQLDEIFEEVRNELLSHFLDLDAGLLFLEAGTKSQDKKTLEALFRSAEKIAWFTIPQSGDSFAKNLTKDQLLKCCQWQLIRMRHANPNKLVPYDLSLDHFKKTAVETIDRIRGDASSEELPELVFRLWAEIHFEYATQKGLELEELKKFIQERRNSMRSPEIRRLLQTLPKSDTN